MVTISRTSGTRSCAPELASPLVVSRSPIGIQDLVHHAQRAADAHRYLSGGHTRGSETSNLAVATHHQICERLASIATRSLGFAGAR